MILSKKCDTNNANPYSKYQIVIITLLTPIAEEFLFRGFFLRFMENYMNKFKSMLLTSFLFSFLHQKLTLQEHIIIFIFSLWWCFVSYATNTVYSSIILHFIQNFLVSLNYLDTNNMCGISYFGFILLFIIGSVFCIIYVYSFPFSLFSEPKSADTSSILDNGLFFEQPQETNQNQDASESSDDSNSNSSDQNIDFDPNYLQSPV